MKNNFKRSENEIIIYSVANNDDTVSTRITAEVDIEHTHVLEMLLHTNK